MRGTERRKKCGPDGVHLTKGKYSEFALLQLLGSHDDILRAFQPRTTNI